MRDRIEEVLDQVRPALQADGGDVELIDFHEGIVTVPTSRFADSEVMLVTEREAGGDDGG